MRKRNDREVVVNQPGKGLLTNLPPDLQDNRAGQFIVRAKNVRAEDGQLKSAPGYERIHLDPANLDSPANLIHQANITAREEEQRKVPLIGTEGRLYALRKRARPLVCPYGCNITFCAIGDSGKVGSNAAAVAGLVRSMAPNLVLHAGDLVYADGYSGALPDEDPYEDQVARYYSWAMGPYGGGFPHGDKRIFYPVLGNHDWDDGPGARYLEFFNLPGNERYYDIKRGPVHFFFLDSYGYGPTSTGPGGASIDGTGAASGVGQADLSSTGPMAVWLQAALSATDCPLRVVVMHHPAQTSEVNYQPGYAVLDWPFGDWGVDLVITGHSHLYERITRADGVTLITVGTGGHSLRAAHGTLVSGSQFTTSTYGALIGYAQGNALVLEFRDTAGSILDATGITPGRALSVCYIGDNAMQAVALRVVPASQTVTIGQTFPFEAVVEYADGSTEVVTAKAEWESSDSGIAAVEAGKTTGIAAGAAAISANFEGLIGSATVSVELSCEDTPLDLVIVFDRSESMETPGSSGYTRIERAKTGLGLLFDELDDEGGDRVGLVHFGGVWRTQSPDVVVASDLTTDYEKVKGLASEITPTGYTGIADALDAASSMLSSQHKEGHRKTVLLFTDGYANILSTNDDPLDDGSNWNAIYAASMDAVTAKTTALKANDDTLVIVIGLDVSRDPARYATVQSWATEGFYYDAANADELVALFAGLLQTVCKGVTSGSGLGVGLDNL